MNESPTAIELLANGGQLAFTKDAARINENSPIGTVVGTLVARDEDIVESLSFSLDDDAKGAFSVESTAVCINNTIGGSSLQTLCSALLKVSGPLNYEEDANKSIIVRVTDKGGLHHSKAFSISVLDQNDQPTNITLNRLHVGFVNENDPDTLIGTLETEDEDYDQHYRYVSSFYYLITTNGGSTHFTLNGVIQNCASGVFDFQQSRAALCTS